MGHNEQTGAVKFGAIVGDGCRIEANPVLAPGTILSAKTVVQRLSLIEERPDSTQKKLLPVFHVFINFEPVDGSVEAEGSGRPLKCRAAL